MRKTREQVYESLRLVARFAPLLVAFGSVLAYLLLPAFRLSDLLFGLGVGAVGLAFTYPRSKARTRQVISIVILALSVLLFFFGWGFAPIIGLAGAFAVYPWEKHSQNQAQSGKVLHIDGPVVSGEGEALDARNSQGLVYKPGGEVSQQFGDVVHGDKHVHVYPPAEPQSQETELPTISLAPHKPYEPETVLIPAGEFLMGSQENKGVPSWEKPQHTVELPAYQIGIYPVTNRQYAEFVRQTGRVIAPEAGWEGQRPPPDKLDHPVSGVTWYDALEYCEWLSEQTEKQYTLPSEAQWEKAARGADGRDYPWGDEWDPDKCNCGKHQTTPIGFYPAGVSPYGCYDMIGNVCQWTSTLWGERPRSPTFCYPWTDDHRQELTASRYVLRIHRGGGTAESPDSLRCSARGADYPDKPGPPRQRYGCRVVLLST